MLNATPGLSVEEMSLGEARKAFASQNGALRNGLDGWTPLHDPTYLSLWERLLGSRDSCRIVVAWDAAGNLAAYAPLMRTRGRFGPVRVPTLRFIGNNIGYPGDILYSEVFSKREEPAAVAAVLEHVASTWSVKKWELGYQRPSSRTWHAASRTLGMGFIAPAPSSAVPFLSLRLPREWEAYFASLSANTRSTYRRGLHHLESLGALRVVFERTPETARRRVEELIGNHTRWLAGTDREGWFGGSRVRKFLAASYELLAREGHALAATLELNGAPIAWIVGPTWGRIGFEHLSSYDRTYSEGSPGLVLGLDLMRELALTGVERVNLGPGAALFKSRLRGTEALYAPVLGYQGWTRRVVAARGVMWGAVPTATKAQR